MIRSKLADLMRERQLTASALARLAGVNRSTITALASNRASRIDLDSLERLCTVFNRQIGELLEIVPDEVPANLRVSHSPESR